MTLAEELTELRDDLVSLGDTDCAVLVERALSAYQRWDFDEGERLLGRALEARNQHEPQTAAGGMFGDCAHALA